MTCLCRLVLPLLGAVVLWAGTPPQAPFPADPRQVTKTVSYGEMAAFLKEVARPGLITVTEEGKSTGGRSLFLVRLNRGGAKATFRAFLYAQQHGNEVSGKDALLTLIREVAARPSLLPQDVDLYLMPMVNPDGAEVGQRRNGADADLNRDHLLLAQPETRALHRAAQRILPHLAVDSHEFTRDGKAYASKGWACWELITMDALNHPLHPGYLRNAALGMVESSRQVMAKARIPYTRYTVGGLPPDEEIRPSTTEVTDGRNSLGALGAASFIIEAGVLRSAKDPQADLGRRVDAYRRLYQHLLGTPASRARLRALSDRARQEPLPPFLATNFFWANLGGKVAPVKVTEAATGRELDIVSPNLMFDLVVKASVATPAGYAIDASAAAKLGPVLEAHGIRYDTLKIDATMNAESCRLLRVEEPFDEIYQRYENRQVVARAPLAPHLFAPGTLIVPLDQPQARAAIMVLEPCMLYGIFGEKSFRGVAAADGTLPVWRLGALR